MFEVYNFVLGWIPSYHGAHVAMDHRLDAQVTLANQL